MRARRLDWRQPAAAPFLGILALIVAGSLFATQTFAQLGDPTLASVALAVATALLPLAMLVGLWRSRAREGSVVRAAHAIAAVAVLQWCAVLAAWGMLPFRLWS